MLHITNLKFHYGKRSVLRDFSLHLPKGEIATLIGASGVGKTTLFKILIGSIKAQDGTVKINNASLPQANAFVSCMMQEDLLLPWRSVLNNITLPGELGTMPQKKAALKVEAQKLLMVLGLQNYADAMPHELSGGMRKRIALGQALMQQRPLLLLDEPFGSLDLILREELYAWIKQIQETLQMTMLIITHDFRDAISLSDRIFLLKEGIVWHEWLVSEKQRQDPQSCHELMNEMRNCMR